MDQIYRFSSSRKNMAGDGSEDCRRYIKITKWKTLVIMQHLMRNWEIDTVQIFVVVRYEHGEVFITILYITIYWFSKISSSMSVPASFLRCPKTCIVFLIIWLSISAQDAWRCWLSVSRRLWWAILRSFPCQKNWAISCGLCSIFIPSFYSLSWWSRWRFDFRE